jgi:membrane-bound metal-dependent hydrolase YbcI (DUF457 family)
VSVTFSRRRRAEAYADPVLHGLVAAAVALPLGRRPVAASVAAGFLIDFDHVVVARSIDPAAMWTLPRRPLSHSATAAALSGALVGTVAGRRYGWAAFAGLLSHVLRDAVEGKTPLLWPWASREHAPERVLVLGSAGLMLGSWAISRGSAAGA